MLYNPTLPTTHNFINLTGQVFTRLTVLRLYGRNRHGHTIWECLCSCGRQKIIAANSLRRGLTKSCGCLNTEIITQKRRTGRHWESCFAGNTPEYKAYCEAKTRCNNVKGRQYADYGGRGIKVLFQSYEEFLDHIGRRPSPKHSLDRINNEGHYEIGNVRWATWEEQQNNQRSNHHVTIHGESLTICQWARKRGVRSTRIFQRIAYGYCEECAILLPFRQRCPHNQRRTALAATGGNADRKTLEAAYKTARMVK